MPRAGGDPGGRSPPGPCACSALGAPADESIQSNSLKCKLTRACTLHTNDTSVIHWEMRRIERRGFNTQAVMRLTGLTHRKLVYLDRTGLVKPSIRPAAGSGTRRVYSFEDLVGLRALAEMRQAGLSLQAVRSVVSHLRRHQTKPLASLSLILEGNHVFVRTDSPRTLEELTAGGQFAMVLPVEGIVERLNQKVTEITAVRAFTVRVGGRDYRAEATPDLEVGGFSVCFPDVPGCFSEADTMRQARHAAREAIEAYLGVGVGAGARVRRTAR